LFDPFLNKFRFREVHSNRNGIFIARNLEQVQGLVGKPAGIQREDLNAPGVLGDHVEQHHVFQAKTAGKGARSVLCFDLLQ
jgi:hypothetical protein